MSSLSLALLGTLDIRGNGRSLSGIESQKGEALLAYLAATAGQRHKRKALALLLWPDKSASAGRKNLRQALYNLRQSLPPSDNGDGWLNVTRQEIRLPDCDEIWVDVHQFEELIGQVEQHTHPAPHTCPDCAVRLQTAVDLYRGDFLSNFSLPDSDDFNQWQTLQRETYHSQVMWALSHLATYYERAGEIDAAIQALRRQVELEPWREEAHQQLMRLLARSGQRAAALQEYEQYLQYLNDTLGATPDETLTALYHKIEAGEPLSPSLSSENPYQGLDSFTPERAAYFFGREAITSRLQDTLEETGLVGVIGPSGSGKSSLVQAGLLPRLTAADRWLTPVFRPGPDPLGNLTQALLALHPDRSPSLPTVKSVRAALESGEMTLPQVADHILENASPAEERPLRLLLVIDSFEELYTIGDDVETRRRFIDHLLEAAVSPPTDFRVLLTLRADFTSQVLAYRPLADALQAGGIALGPMTNEEMARAIVEPARLQGATFESGVVARLLADVGDGPGRLPLLSFTLNQLWQNQENGRLTHTAYEALGQVGGAISQYANQVYEQLDEDEQQVAQRIFTQLVHLGQHTADTRRPATRHELGEAAWRLIPTLADARLVVSGRNNRGEETVELVHETLISHWDRLQTWLDEDRAFRLWQQRLRTLAHHWEVSERDKGALLRGAPLAEAEAWLAQRGDELSPAEQEFIRASLARRQAQEQAEAARRRRELAQAQALADAEHQRAETEARAGSRLRTLLTIAAISLVIAILAAFYAAGQRNAAQDQAQLAGQAQATAEAERSLAGAEAAAHATEVAVRGTAEAVAAAEAEARATEVAVRSTAEAEAIAAGEMLETEQLAAEAQARLAQTAQLVAESRLAADTQPVRSLLLAISANQILGPKDPYRPAAVQALREILNRPWGTPLPGVEAVVEWIAVHPRSRWLVTANQAGEILLRPLADPIASPRRLATIDGDIKQLALGPEGRHLAVSSNEGVVYLWDLADLDAAATSFTGHSDMVDALAFSPDGRFLASGSRDGTTRLWDLADPAAAPRLFPGEEGWIWRVAFSPDGEWLATGSFDGFIRLWSLADPAADPAIIPAHEIWVRALTFSPDGEWLVSGAADAAVKVWSVAAPEAEPQLLSGHENHVVDIAFSPDGRLLATAAFDNTARVWQWEDREAPPIVLEEHDNLVKDVALSPDGAWLATASDDGAARLWPTSDLTAEPVTLHGHDDQLMDIVFTPDSKHLITSGKDKQVRLWSMDRPQQPFTPRWLSGHSDGISNFMFRSSRDQLVTTSYDGTALLWEDDGEQITLRHESSIIDSALSPDHNWLATGTFDGVVRLWSLAEPEAEPIVLHDHTNEVWDVAFTPDGRFLASGSLDGAVRLWSVPDGEAVGELVHEGTVVNLAISPDGKWLVAAGGDPNFSASIWQLANLETEPVVLGGFEDQVWDADFSPDGRWLALGSWDSTVRLYSTADLGATPTIIGAESGRVDHVRFSPDGRWLVSAGQSLSLWSLDDLTAPPLELVGHQRGVNDLAFSPDGRWLATASRDQTVRLWALQAPEALPQVLPHGAIVDSIAFSPDGGHLFSSTEHGAMRQWTISSAALAKIACNVAVRSFLPSEQTRYFDNGRAPLSPCG